VGPERTCVGCRKVAPAATLVRVARDASGSLVLGRDHPGRGAWLCAAGDGMPDMRCLDQATRRQAFHRAFRATVGEQAIEALRRTVRERESIEIGVAAGRAAGRD